jgi:predicted permease
MNASLQRLKRRLRYWLRHSERQRLLREEMQFHMDALAQELREPGMTEEDARGAARRKFGNPTLKAEESRGTWIAQWISDGMQDLRYTFRTLRRDAGFTTFAILIVGLGIGASSIVFSVVNALVLRPLAFNDPHRLVWIENRDIDTEGMSGITVPTGHFTELRDHNQSFADVGGYYPGYGVGDSKLTGDGEPQRLTGVAVTYNFFSLLGAKPLLGRLFNADESKAKWFPFDPKVTVLSYDLWRRRFNSDPGVIGRQLTVNDLAVTVIGILPPPFDFGNVFAPGTRADLFFPFPLTAETNHWGNTLVMVGRLKPGVTMQQARAELRVLCPQIKRRDPDRNFDLLLSGLDEHVSGRQRPALFVLACAVAVVMLIVCANLSNLLLARTATRQKEMGIRAALGAGRERLIRQMLTESVVLSCCGAALGLLLAAAGTRLLSHLHTLNIPMLESVRIDTGELVFTLLMAVATGLVFGLVPALQVRGAAVRDSMKENNRGASQSKRHVWIRGSLVVAEIAFACVLLVGAGLLIRSFLHVLDVNPGFQPERAAALRVDPSSQYSTQAKRNAYYDEALHNVRLIPGIEAAGLTDALPLGSDRTWSAMAKGRIYTRDNPPPPAFVRIVSDGYLKALGIALRAGRDISEHDTATRKPVILINETFARTVWPGQDPLGQMALADVDREVIGVVGDVRHLALEKASGCEMYIPIRQTGDYSAVDLVVRSSLPPAGLASSVRAALRPIEPNLPGNEFRTIQDLVDRATGPRRFLVTMLAGFSAFALILAALGIYAVISYSVNQRAQELGIRMALGASAADLQAGIVAQTLRLAGVGMLIGMAAAWTFGRALSGFLYGVTSTDPATFVGMLLVIGAVAIIAGYLPARRASRIDPVLALRAE